VICACECADRVARPWGPVGSCNERTVAGEGATYTWVVSVWTSGKLETTLSDCQVWWRPASRTTCVSSSHTVAGLLT